jgi:hypothetical protein
MYGTKRVNIWYLGSIQHGVLLGSLTFSAIECQLSGKEICLSEVLVGLEEVLKLSSMVRQATRGCCPTLRIRSGG